MPQYRVVREWIVSASSVTDAINKSKVRDHYKVHAKKLPGRNQLPELIEHYATCAIDNSWKGSRDPQDIDMIEKDLEAARAALYDAIEDLLQLK